MAERSETSSSLRMWTPAAVTAAPLRQASSPAPSPQSTPAPQRRRLARDATSQTRTKAIDNDPLSLRRGKAKPIWGNAPRASQARTERLLLDAESAARLRHKLALMNIAAQHIAGHRSHFNPNQPRVPAGNPDGGQWTRSGGGIGTRLAAADKPRFGGGVALAIILEHSQASDRAVSFRKRAVGSVWT
jgi:hypothetical protein